ncbi:MAG: FAD-dependent oxidoreductase [Vicinamibacteria bacterium]|nr:FAD-dependent oxidoreductase [Vicinamibacteria bacterium]
MTGSRPLPRVVVLGGGLSGASVAYALARTKAFEVTVVERGPTLGGLAGSFEREGHFYPLGYHHILHRDRTLLFFLDRIGALSSVEWRRIRMLFRVNERLYNLANPADFLAFPMSLADKARFTWMMARAFGKSDWSDWQDKSAVELLDAWSGPGVRAALFEPLSRLKFELPCQEVSGAWLGARLHHREGSAPLGYIPGANWTKVLCEGITQLVAEQGVALRTSAAVAGLLKSDDQVRAVELVNGEQIEADIVVSTIPAEVYMGLAPEETTPQLADIRYTALVSVICASKKKVSPDFYWMNLASLDRAACGVFLLNSLNPTIGAPGDSCVNFVTHLNNRSRPLFAKSDQELISLYLEDFQAIFGFDLEPFWTNVARVPMYSPVFGRGYRNPPPRSSRFPNVYFAGNYRTFPSIVSTGTALFSGVETAEVILADHGLPADLSQEIRSFRR